LPGTSAGSSKDGKALLRHARHANCRPGDADRATGLIYHRLRLDARMCHPYHGWVFCYAYDGSAFTQKGVFCTTPDA
jgi:hypothetical protein